MNELSVTEEQTIVGLLRLGWSERRIARETGHHRATIRRCARAERALKSLAPPVTAEPGDDSKCTSRPKVATDSERSRSRCEPHRTFIETETAKGRNATAIYQDLVEHYGYEGAYNAVKRFARALVPRSPKVSCRFETDPGQEAQVDYGEGARTKDPRTGKYRKPRLFVMTLGCSRNAFRKTVWKSSQQIWAELHEEGFAYFGGATATVRLDNLREGVGDPDIYDPVLNPLYAAVLKHYGVVALPCRPYAPDLKGKVESAVGHTQRTALLGRTFESIEEQNAFLQHWNERWAMTRIHGTTKRQVRVMFEEERPFLRPLPPTRFEYYRIFQRRVHLDSHIEVNGAYYSVPPRYVGATVMVHAGRLWLRVLDPVRQECIREHIIATTKGSRRTIDSDRPKQTPPQVHKLIERVAAAGPSCGAFARAIEAERGALAIRTIFGLLDLLRKHPAPDVDRACALALSAGTQRLRFVRTFLARDNASPLTDHHRIIAPIDTYNTHFSTITRGKLLP